MKKVILILIVAAFMFGCGETAEEKFDRWMTELDCPVILEGKTDKAVDNPAIVVRDGKGRVRTFEYYYEGARGFSDMPAAIASSREIGDTLKPCN